MPHLENIRLESKPSGPLHSHWLEFPRDARSSFASFAPELPPGTLECHGMRRIWRVGRAMFFRLSPARRSILVLALALQLSSLFAFSDSLQWIATYRGVLSFACVLAVLAVELADRVALKRDLELAREIQSWLVPKTPPHYEGLDIAFSTRPANTVAGDYYDVIPLPATDDAHPPVLFVVADVAGKGIPAGLLTACFRSCLHTLADTTADLRDLARRLHDSCCGESGGGRHFTTAVLAKYDSPARSLEYVNAGHNPPLLRSASGSITQLDATGMPFGMFRPAAYEARRVLVGPGDLLLIYTDGIVEAVNHAGDEYGLDRLRSFLRETQAPSAEFQRRLFDSISAFTGGAPQQDDITALVVQFA